MIFNRVEKIRSVITLPQPGDIIRVFDDKLWGGKDHPEGNARFYKEAEVLTIRVRKQELNKRGEYLVDVKFLHDGRISHGHYLHATYPKGRISRVAEESK